MIHFGLENPDIVEETKNGACIEQRKYYDRGDIGRCVKVDQYFPSFYIAQLSGFNYTGETIHTEIPYEKDTINSCFLINSNKHLRSVHPGKVDFVFSSNQYNIGYFPNMVGSNYSPAYSETHMFHITYHKDHVNSLLESDEGWNRTFANNIEKDNFYMAFEKCLPMSLEMQRIIFELRHPMLKGTSAGQYMESRVLDLLRLHIQLAMKHKGLDDATRFSEADKQKLKAVKDFLRNNYTNPDVSLTMLCREFGLNEFKLKKGFKTLFNTSVFGYMLDLKMDEAHQLLADKVMSVTEVSDHLGYSHPGHFTKAFKKKFQVLPSMIG